MWSSEHEAQQKNWESWDTDALLLWKLQSVHVRHFVVAILLHEWSCTKDKANNQDRTKGLTEKESLSPAGASLSLDFLVKWYNNTCLLFMHSVSHDSIAHKQNHPNTGKL